LITGIAGQDGYYLNRFLMDQGVETYGLDRRSMIDGRTGKKLMAVSLAERASIDRVIDELAPDEIYHLAAYHGSSEQDITEDPCETIEKSLSVHTLALAWLLESVRRLNKNPRVFYASSSLIFGNPTDVPQTEESAISPICAYGLSKAAGMNVCALYRDQHDVFVSSGILYNHESARRRASFVSRKIVKTAVAIKQGRADRLVLGNLNAGVDWGYAPDYVRAMQLIVQCETPDDFIIATGELRTVGDFVREVFDLLDMQSEGRVVEDGSLITRSPRRNALIGDARKLRSVTGWRPDHSLSDIAAKMVEAELSESAT